MTLPTKESLEETKINMDTVDEFINSSESRLIDQYGSTRKTLAGIESEGVLGVVNVTIHSTTVHTLLLGEVGSLVQMDSGNSNIVTVPVDVFSANQTISIVQVGDGQTSISAQSGVTINTPETLRIRRKNSIVQLICTGDNTFQLFGDLELL